MAQAKVCFLLHFLLPANKLNLLTVPRERTVALLMNFKKMHKKKVFSFPGSHCVDCVARDLHFTNFFAKYFTEHFLRCILDGTTVKAGNWLFFSSAPFLKFNNGCGFWQGLGTY